jgi:hypothetical protein
MPILKSYIFIPFIGIIKYYGNEYLFFFTLFIDNDFNI